MSPAISPPPKLFKGIALFTPGGDLVYCIDIHKQNRWHLQLCAVLQDMLGLPEPPYFLVPFYTATLDRWLDPKTQQLRTFSEACPAVLRYQALLNMLFGTENVVWETRTSHVGLGEPSVLSTYRHQFPQLWDDHDLVVRLDSKAARSSELTANSTVSWAPMMTRPEAQGYVLRLFVAGYSVATERILHNLHQILETSLHQPYTLKVVDIHKHPEQAEASQITATPTLVKVWPYPIRRIVGDLDDVSKLLQALKLDV